MGGESWDASGSAIYYVFDVPEDGMYSITLRALQNTRNNFTVFRKITINDAVVFAELNEVAFPNQSKWKNYTLGGEQTPYRIFLNQGKNTLGIEAPNSPYQAAIEKILGRLILNTLAPIKKLPQPLVPKKNLNLPLIQNTRNT
jgi:hypothetical protein